MAKRKTNTKKKDTASGHQAAVKTPTAWLVPALPLRTDRPCGAPPGSRGFFITATPMNADGKPDGCEFALAKCETEDDARVLIEHVESKRGSLIERIGAGTFRAGHAIRIRVAADLHDDDRIELEGGLMTFLRLPQGVETHRARGGDPYMAIVESPRLELTQRLTDEARRLTDERRAAIAKAEGQGVDK